MASSEVKICNLGLNMIGQQSIISLTQDDKKARHCNLVYEPLRDEVLTAYPWRFALYRDTLALLSENPAFDYDYQFQLPADCLRVLGMDYSDYVFDIEGDKLLCNNNTANILYIKRITDPNLFGSIFITALATRIASELAIPLVKSKTLAESMFKKYVMLVTLGQGADSQQGVAQDIGAEDWTSAHEG